MQRKFLLLLALVAFTGSSHGLGIKKKLFKLAALGSLCGSGSSIGTGCTPQSTPAPVVTTTTYVTGGNNPGGFTPTTYTVTVIPTATGPTATTGTYTSPTYITPTPPSPISPTITSPFTTPPSLLIGRDLKADSSEGRAQRRPRKRLQRAGGGRRGQKKRGRRTRRRNRRGKKTRRN